MNKKIIKEVNETILTMFIGITIVAIIVGSLFGIIHLTKIHWIFYGLILVWMWIILYIMVSITEENDSKGRVNK